MTEICRRRKALAPVCLVCIAILAAVTRCLHLLDAHHYYVISADSYFFHWEARRLLEGGAVPMSWHSGITYPVAYMARAISVISGASIDQSLMLASILVPVLLGVVSVLLLYFTVSRMFDRRVAILSAFGWALAPIAALIQGAGYLDRDGLSVVLIMTGAFLFYQSAYWHARVLGRDFGWLLAVLGLGVIELLLYLEWVWIGPALLVAILCLGWAAEVAFDVARRVMPALLKPDLDVMAIPGYIVSACPPAFRASNWRPLLIVLLGNVVGAAMTGVGGRSMLDLLKELSGQTASGSHAIAELQGMTLGSLTIYNGLLVASIVGIAIGCKRMGRADAFVIGWFGGLLLAGLFVGRLFLYAGPALCVLSGVGLAYLIDASGLSLSSLKVSFMLGNRSLLRYARVAAGVFLIILAVGVSFASGYQASSTPLIAADNDWQRALFYLRDNSDPEAVVMCHWGFGYFIRDLADRKPYVDNGIWDDEKNRDVACAYTATDPSEAAAIMEDKGVRYLVFSTEYSLLPVITEDAFGESYGDGLSIPEEMENSLYAKSLSGSFWSGEGLHRVYPDGSVDSPSVVILELD